MAKKTTPSNSNVAKKLAAMKKAASKPEEKKPVPKKANSKEACRKKVPAKTRKSKKSEEPEKKVIDYSSYPKTPIVIAWQNMVQGALDRYEATIVDEPSEEQKKRIEIFKHRLERAPYELRGSGQVKREMSDLKPHLPISQKKATTKRKRKTLPKKKK